MEKDTVIDWKVFEYKFSDNPQKAFENLSYILFCHEFHQDIGIFRYKNQHYIETNPIQVGNQLIGFQSKYYSENGGLSGKKTDLINAVKGAANKYSGLTNLYFYISPEPYQSSKKNQIKPKYMVEIEREAEKLGIEIEWRGKSNIETMLMLDDSLTLCRNVFFQLESPITKCCKHLESHTAEIISHINISIKYRNEEIILRNNSLNLDDFLHSDKQVLLIYGDAGSGKSALVKRTLNDLTEPKTVLAFQSTDMDVRNESQFMTDYGDLTLDELFDIYKYEDNRFLFIDGAEKFFEFKNQHFFEYIISNFINAGWKLIFTIRTAYRTSFSDSLLNDVKTEEYYSNLISIQELVALSDNYKFTLPVDYNLQNLLCIPFYLRLYLELENVNEDVPTLNRAAFEEKIWKDVMRNERKQRNNMPVRRETVLENVAKKLLEIGNYTYEIKAEDDYEAFNELENTGVLIQSGNSKYSFAHDVFEEITINHIFTKHYKNYTNKGGFFEGIGTSLHARRLFQGWLSKFASLGTHKAFIFNLLSDENVNKIWKNEILLTVINSPELKDILYEILNESEGDSYNTFIRIAHLMNTCCRVTDNRYDNVKKLMRFRLSKPSGYAWDSVFEYIYNNRYKLKWNEELFRVVIDILYSWTSDIDNALSETTEKAGKIGLFLLNVIYEGSYGQYKITDVQEERLIETVANSARMIQDQLEQIFKFVILTEQEIKEISLTLSGKAYTEKLPRICEKITQSAMSDILHCGQIPVAMPEITINLIKTLWFNPNDRRNFYNRENMEGSFGLSHDLSYGFFPASAYRTPIIALLNKDPNLAIGFLIDFMNATGEIYYNSHLNIDYGECKTIILHIEDNEIEQIASDRLWKLYRGTAVGPDALISLLMGFEKWLLTLSENIEEDILTAICRNILMKSHNVMLTSVIVSIAEAYPRKMFAVVCDLLKTKEIFHLDSSRYSSEREATSVYSRDVIFTEERKESNNLKHRNKRLEDIIFEYQTTRKGISADEYNIRIQKLYEAIDNTTSDIDTWNTEDKYAYYRMDLRRNSKINQTVNEDGSIILYTLKPDFSEDMIENSQQNFEQYNRLFKHMELQMWGDYKFNEDPKYQQFEKYEDINEVIHELKEIWEILLNYDNESENPELDGITFTINNYITACAYSSAVLLRDYRSYLNNEDVLLCSQIIFELGMLFTQVPNTFFIQLKNGLEAVVCGLLLLKDDSNIKEIGNNNPIYLTLKLALMDRSDDSRVIKEISEHIEKYNDGLEWIFIYLYSKLANLYENELAYGNVSIEKLFNENRNLIITALEKDSIGLSDIDFSDLSEETLLTILPIIPSASNDAVTAVQLTKDKAMDLAFSEKWKDELNGKYIGGYIFNYISWLAEVLLNCDMNEKVKIINFFIEKSNLSFSDNVEQFLLCLIRYGDTIDKAEDFWEIWELLKPSMIQLGSGYEQQYISTRNNPFGRDRIITCYLFANTVWQENAHNSPLITKNKMSFFDDFIKRSDSLKAMLFAISKLLDTIGQDSYMEKGIEWISGLIDRDPECKLMLYDNTLFYLEDYMAKFIDVYRDDFRQNDILMSETQNVLEYMVNQDSQVAFFLREEI